MRVCCVFSLESPHRAFFLAISPHRDYSNEDTQYNKFNIISLNHSQICGYGFLLQVTQERVLVRQDNRVIRVRAIEVLLCNVFYIAIHWFWVIVIVECRHFILDRFYAKDFIKQSIFHGLFVGPVRSIIKKEPSKVPRIPYHFHHHEHT